MATRPGKTRPYKTLSAEQIEILPDLAGKLSKTQLAAYLGMSINTFNRICEDEPEIGLIYEQGRAVTTDAVASALIKKAKSGDVHAMKFYLERMSGWNETTVVKQETKKVKSFGDMYDDDDEDEDGDS